MTTTLRTRFSASLFVRSSLRVAVTLAALGTCACSSALPADAALPTRAGGSRIQCDPTRGEEAKQELARTERSGGFDVVRIAGLASPDARAFVLVRSHGGADRYTAHRVTADGALRNPSTGHFEPSHDAEVAAEAFDYEDGWVAFDVTALVRDGDGGGVAVAVRRGGSATSTSDDAIDLGAGLLVCASVPQDMRQAQVARR